MNYIVMIFLCDQYNKFNNEFDKCIDDRGKFHGNFEQCRRRHQDISRSVQEADRFLMISNVACFCCEIAIVILTLYSIIFYRQDTVSLGAEWAILYAFLLTVNLFGLLLTTGLAIMVTLTVSRLCSTNPGDALSAGPDTDTDAMFWSLRKL